MTKKLTTEEFIAKATAVHGDKFSYEKVEYVNNTTKVEIICKHHDSFWQVPSTHLQGGGCLKCANKLTSARQQLTNEQWVAKAKKARGDAYDYSKANYQSCRGMVTLTCNTCQHVFEQDANNHLQGAGCPACANYGGYRPHQPGTLYVLVSDNTTKVGITNKPTARRASQVSTAAGKKFSVLWTKKFDDGSIPKEIETKVLGYLKSTYERPKERYNGWTESFLSVDRAFLVQHIEELITQGTA